MLSASLNKTFPSLNEERKNKIEKEGEKRKEEKVGGGIKKVSNYWKFDISH